MLECSACGALYHEVMIDYQLFALRKLAALMLAIFLFGGVSRGQEPEAAQGMTLYAMDDDFRTDLALYQNGKRVKPMTQGRYIATFSVTVKSIDVLVLQASDTSRGCFTFVLVDKQGKVVSYSKAGMPVSRTKKAVAVVKEPKKQEWERARHVEKEDFSRLRTTAGVPNEMPDDWCAVWLQKEVKGDCFSRVYPIEGGP